MFSDRLTVGISPEKIGYIKPLASVRAVGVTGVPCRIAACSRNFVDYRPSPSFNR